MWCIVGHSNDFFSNLSNLPPSIKIPSIALSIYLEHILFISCYVSSACVYRCFARIQILSKSLTFVNQIHNLIKRK